MSDISIGYGYIVERAQPQLSEQVWLMFHGIGMILSPTPHSISAPPDEVTVTSERKTKTVAGASDQSFTQKYREGQKIRTADGHLVRSRAEKITDNWLYHHRVIHACEQPLFLSGREKPIVPDWTLEFGKVHLEFVGMLDNPNYKKHWDWKQKLYAQHGIPVIILLPKNIEAGLDYRFPPKLQEFGVSFI